jgi:methyltransferase FkbM-like protein
MAGESSNPVRRALAPVLGRAIKGRSGAVRRLPLGPGRGLRMELHPTSPLDMYMGLYEYELARHVERLCAPGAVCFDIGAFDGYYALLFARLTGSTVVVFDADPESCARVRRNCELNPELGARVEVRESYVAFETNPAQNCVALDDVLSRGEILVPGLMKLDVDRAELSALTGAKGLLAAHRPHLIVEVHSVELERQCAELLIELGYRPRIVTERKWLRENRPIEHNRWIVAEGRS